MSSHGSSGGDDDDDDGVGLKAGAMRDAERGEDDGEALPTTPLPDDASGDEQDTTTPTTLMAGEWVCDQCGFINTQDDFPCSRCEYPLIDMDEQRRAHAQVFEGSATSVGVEPESGDPHARVRHPPPKTPTQLERSVSMLSEQEQERVAAPVPHLNWQCPLCFLIGEEAPCICCGYDPLSDKEQPSLADREEPEEPELSLYEQQVAAGAKVVATSHGPQAGPMPIRGGGFRFRVWAPHAVRICVMGDFNDWKQEDPETEMQLEANYTHWRVDIPTAKAGHRYAFLVRIQQERSSVSSTGGVSGRPRRTTRWVSRADPRSPALLRSSHTRHGYISALYDHSAFHWTDQDFRPPPLNTLVLYELHVGTFAPASGGQHAQDGTFLSLLRRLDYLSDLGVNAIALMPITHDAHPDEKHEFPCWGYDPLSLFAVHPSYGTPDELKMLVNAAHERGMCVIFDAVFNHMHARSVLQFWDGTNLYFSKERTEWGPRPRFTDTHVQDYIIDSVVSFFRDYHMDGVRVDSTSNVRGQGHDIPGGWQLLQRLNDVVHEQFPSAFTIAEDLYDDRRLNTGGAGFDLQWCQGSFRALFHAAICPSDRKRGINAVAEHIRRSHPGEMGGRLLYTENHDTVPGDREQRIPVAIVHGDADRVESFYPIARSTLIAAIMFCTPGVPMLLQGQEVLETKSPLWPWGPSVDWTRLNRFPGVYQVYQRLVALRKNMADNTLGLTGPYVRVHHRNSHDTVLALHRWERGGPGDDVVVIVNFSNKIFSSYRVGFPREGQWTVRLCTTQLLAEHGRKHAQDGDIHVPEHIHVTPERPRDGYPFSGAIALPRYSVTFLSQNGAASLVFRVRRETEWGASVGISGSDPALGEWEKPVVLRTDTADAIYPWWQSDPIPVPARTQLFFKIVLVEDERIVWWEQRENRSVCPPRGRHLLLLS